jgi:Ca2+-binding RTX toxin-like protein
VDHYTVPGGTIGNADRFVFERLADAHLDLITDFHPGEDALDFRAVGPGLAWSTTSDGVRTYLDLTHAGESATIVLVGEPIITAEDILL